MSDLITGSWLPTKFTDLLDVQGGTQPPKSQFLSEPTDNYVRLLQIRDFGKKPVPTYVPDTTKLKKCTSNEVLIGRYGASLGRICTGMDGAYNVALAKVVAPEGIESKYIRYYLLSETFQNPLALLSRSAQNGFNKKDLASFDFPLPPLAEQKQIAAKLDELLAQVDSLKTGLDAIPAILKRFRQSVLAAAVSGRLTEDWRNIQKPQDEWQQFTIDELSKDEKYSLGIGPFGSNLKVADYKIEGHPLVFVREIRARKFGGENTKYVSPEKFSELKQHRANPGDILITKMGDPPGDVAIYPMNCPTAVITSDCIKLDADPAKITTPFVFYCMCSESFRAQVAEISGGVAQQKVNLKRFRLLSIDTPSLEEQTEIVRQVEALFHFADQVEQKIKAAQSHVDKLTESILAKAFRGELTAQWREDNPDLISGKNSAEALLARIQAERGAQPKGGGRGNRKAKAVPQIQPAGVQAEPAPLQVKKNAERTAPKPVASAESSAAPISDVVQEVLDLVDEAQTLSRALPTRASTQTPPKVQPEPESKAAWMVLIRRTVKTLDTWFTEQQLIAALGEVLGYKRLSGARQETLVSAIETAYQWTLLVGSEEGNDGEEEEAIALYCEQFDQLDNDALDELLPRVQRKNSSREQDELFTLLLEAAGFQRRTKNAETRYKNYLRSALRRGLLERTAQGLKRIA